MKVRENEIAVEQLKNESSNTDTKDVIVIRRGWSKVVLISIIGIIMINGASYDPKASDIIIGMLIILIPILWYQCIMISSTFLTIDLKKKQAYYSDSFTKATITEITSMTFSRTPVLEMFNSITIIGKGFGNAISVTTIRDYPKVEEFVMRFNSSNN